MKIMTRAIILLAMTLLGIVSMWTTYRSLTDSILPEPLVRIHLSGETYWDCSIFALGLSVAIGLMLFALKMAIVDEQKRLNILGIVGMTVVAFISISFNLDVLYRTADREFFIRYTDEKMRSVYEDYFSEAQSKLLAKRDAVRKDVAAQEGELDAETRGLRGAPEGYGPLARQEDYKLTVMQKTSAVELEAVDEALAQAEQADALLRNTTPQTVEEIEQLENELRVAAKDIGASVQMSLPPRAKADSPLFAVFARLFDLKTVGIKEVFFLLLAFFLDLGDIIGYSLIPNKPDWSKKRKEKWPPRGPSSGFDDELEALALPSAVNEGLSAKRPSLTDESGSPSLPGYAESDEVSERQSRRAVYFGK